MSQNLNERPKELPLPVYRSPDVCFVIVRHDDTGVRSYWTGKAEWAWSIDYYDAVFFAHQLSAKVTLDGLVRPSEGAKLHFAQYPKDQLYVEGHTWTEVPKR